MLKMYSNINHCFVIVLSYPKFNIYVSLLINIRMDKYIDKLEMMKSEKRGLEFFELNTFDEI